MRGLWVLLGVGCGAGPVTAENYTERLVAVICDQEMRCGESWYLLDGEEGCLELVGERFGIDDLDDSPCLTYDVEQGQICLDALAVAPCDARAANFVFPDSCNNVWLWDDACEG